MNDPDYQHSKREEHQHGARVICHRSAHQGGSTGRNIDKLVALTTYYLLNSLANLYVGQSIVEIRNDRRCPALTRHQRSGEDRISEHLRLQACESLGVLRDFVQERLNV